MTAVFGSYSDNYAEGELGLSFDRSEGTGGYGIRLGYKRILTGERQLWRSALLKMNAGPCCRYAVGERAGTILRRRLMSGMISAENGRLAGSLSGDWSNGGREIGARLDFAYHF